MSQGKQSITQSNSTRPDIYGYHDYRPFLGDWIAWLKASKQGFSVRWLSKQSGVSESYISMVLSGERSISELQLSKILTHLDLDSSEQSYLEWLQIICESGDGERRLEALGKIQRFRQYREMNPLEIEAYHYLTNWHYVMIRELTALPDFKPDPQWIRERMKYKLPITRIRKALEFLTSHGFVEQSEGGVVSKPDKRIHAKTGVLKPALAQFHREMLTLAGESIDTTPSEKRNISAHTCAIPVDKFAEAKKILEEARERIISLGQESDKPEVVYHFAFLAFPLTKEPAQ